MNKIGLFFGTETGTDRLVAKKIHKLLGEYPADKPVNVNRSAPDEILRYGAFAVGNGRFAGLAVDRRNQGCKTGERLKVWAGQALAAPPSQAADWDAVHARPCFLKL